VLQKRLLKYQLLIEGLLHKESNNLGDVLEKYIQLAQAFETTLAKRHAGSSHQNYKVVTPHQNLNYNTWLSQTKAKKLTKSTLTITCATTYVKDKIQKQFL